MSTTYIVIVLFLWAFTGLFTMSLAFFLGWFGWLTDTVFVIVILFNFKLNGAETWHYLCVGVWYFLILFSTYCGYGFRWGVYEQSWGGLWGFIRKAITDVFR